MDVLLFIISFALILIGCEFFTNGVEWLGKRFGLEEGAVGSVLAAIGTAMPETLVPLIAIVLIGGESGEEIGAGAILGSPFMLATVALFICGVSLILFKKRRERKTLMVKKELVRRDLKFFLIAYSMAAFVAIAPSEISWVRWVVGFSLFPIYLYYMYITLRTKVSEGEEDMEELLFQKGIDRIKGRRKGITEQDEGLEDTATERFREAVYKDRPGLGLIIVQIAMGLFGIILGATMFVEQVRYFALDAGLNPLILALIIAPVATELLEMFNSSFWIRDGKDVFALGNITGAMVFQSCIPVTFGVLLTGWTLDLGNSTDLLQAVSIGIALFSAALLYVRAGRNEVRQTWLLLGGLFYIAFMIMVLLTI